MRCNMSIEFEGRMCTGKLVGCKLYAPTDYWMNTKKEVLDKYNGMGPDTWWVNWIPRKIRNGIIGLNCGEASYIHDCMYGYNHEDYSEKKHIAYKSHADRVFRNNMMRIIKHEYDRSLDHIGNGWFSSVRKWWASKKFHARQEQAMGYYVLVRDMGDTAFWANKNKDLGD